MEAVTAIIKNLLKNMRIVLVLGVILGLLLGIIFAWGIWPAKAVDTTPEVMRQDLQKDYLRMTIDSYNRTGDPNRAMERWNNLGTASGQTYGSLVADPGYLTLTDVQNFGNLVQSVTGQPIAATPAAEAGGTGSMVLYGSIAVIVLLAAAVGGMYLWRLLR